MKNITFIFGLFLVILGSSFFIFKTPYVYLIESNANLSSGKAAKAINILEDALRKYPNNDKIIFALSKSYLSGGETEQASKILRKKTRKILKDNKDFQDFLVALSKSNLKAGNKKYAKIFGKEYLENQVPDEVSVRVVNNCIQLADVFPEKSVELLEKAYNIAKGLKQSELIEQLKTLLMPEYLKLANKLRLISKYKESMNVLQKAAELGKSAKLSCQQALLYNDLGDIKLAHKKFEEALQLEPDNNSYKLTYANFLKDLALHTEDKSRKKEYFEKVELLLAGGSDNPEEADLLNKLMILNPKYKITDFNLKIISEMGYLYPSLSFMVKLLSDSLPKKYRILLLDNNKNQLEDYENLIESNSIEEHIEFTSEKPIGDISQITAKLFLDNELVKEYKKEVKEKNET